ncbi:NADH dehydrogenase [ubiquinone] 1 beta subcomplex subunit 2, mitochondrial-like [Oratosquilla oratoria]|uniref:NADH dehydrogenase [ubiquinone] 1 beta subcomplex subunit 2, mitochondrial-like n=1 Tax=Oratosquilla oratoria TaxID=337810 RepID=UPI003F763EE0
MFPVRQLIRALPVLTRGIKTTAVKAGGGTYVYRGPPPAPSKKVLYTAEVMGAIMWYWILYHLFTESEHLTGEFPYPDPSLWTNEELGIPDDDDDP